MAYSETEQKIMAAARTIFRQKGLAAARTREIAQEAGVNVALINYYFHSKQELYDVVMKEALQSFTASILSVMNNARTDYHTKLKKIPSNYGKLISEDAELLSFIFANKDQAPTLTHLPQGTASQLAVVQQLREAGLSERQAQQVMLNCMSLIMFPFYAQLFWQHMFGLSDMECKRILKERQSLIPLWLENMIKNYKPE